MHVVTIPDGIAEPIPVSGGTELEGGKSYICTNAFAGSLLMSKWRVVIEDRMWALSPLLSVYKYHPGAFNAKDASENIVADLWLVRGGGWGDLLMLTPMIRHLKKQFPRLTIHVACGKEHHGLFNGLDVIEETIPIEKSKVEGAFLISYEGIIEGHPDAETVHMAQQFSNQAGVELDGDYRPDYVMAQGELEEAQRLFPKGDKKRIGLQYTASALYRTYPMRLTDTVIQLLLAQGVEVFLFGKPGQIVMNGDLPEGLTNLTESKLSFRQSVAVAASCDCMIAPDSAMVHVASALKIPYLGLYGPFPAHIRGSGREGKGIQGKAPCSPCFFHASHPAEFPAGMPCEKAQYCVALAEIKPEQIVDIAIKLSSPIIQLAKHRFRG